MKKTLKRSLASLLAVVMILSATPLSGFVGLELPSFGELFSVKAEAAVGGQMDGELTWSLDTSSGVLTISGTGEMSGTGYTDDGGLIMPPWYRYGSYVKTVVIQEGVTSVSEYAFYNSSENITSISLPNTLVKIAPGAFKYLTLLTSINIPNSVTSIGYEAFYGCERLASITIPDSITYIGENAFYGTAYYSDTNNYIDGVLYISNHLIKADNSNLPAVYTIKDGTKTIAISAFYNCKKLTNITIPDSVTSIGDKAFYNCSSLASVTIGKGVTTIGSSAFYGCTNLKTIIMPDDITYIGEDAFYDTAYSKDLNNYDEDGVLYVGNSLIKAQNTLSGQYEIKSGTTSISRGAFSGCTSLTSITIPDSVTSIGSSAFSGCTSLTSITIPDSITTIGDYAFDYCRSLTSITIPDSVTSIGSSTFYKCSGLVSITMSDSMTSIGNYAFSGCTSLTSITIPDSVTSIGYNAFYNCSSLASVTIGKGVTTIGSSAFYGCTSLKTVDNYSIFDIVVGSSSYGYAGYYADTVNWYFTDNGTCGENLKYEFVVSTGVLTISGTGEMTNYQYGSRVPWHSYCSNIKTVVLPDGITTIGNYAFYGCKSLTNITIPDSVTSIGYDAFYDCSSLASVTIGKGVTTIGSSAFYYCTSLKTVDNYSKLDIVAGSNSYGYAGYYADTVNWCFTGSGKCGVNLSYTFFGSTGTLTISGTGAMLNYTYYLRAPWYSYSSGIKKIVIEDGVTSIESYAFYQCTNLTDVTMSDSVTSIGNYAFYGCKSLTNITIPDSVTSIGYKAFYNCSSLASVTIGKGVTSIGDEAFYGCSNLKTVENYSKLGMVAGDTSHGYVSHYANTVIWHAPSFTDSGTCGDNLNYYFDSETLTLTVTGTGEMANFDLYSSIVPWRDYRAVVETVVIGDGVTGIGERAFSNFNSLKNLTLPDSITSIENYAFSGCRSLTSITLPDSITSIDSSTFSDCSGLVSITIPDNVRYIDSHAFSGCTSLTSITIPNSVTSIAESVFSDCISLTSITIPNSATSIGSHAFDGCIGLTSVIIPSNVTTIGNYAFGDCTSLTSITIPDSVTYIGESAFDNTAYVNDLNNYDESGVVYIGSHLIKAQQSISGAYTVKEETKTIIGSAFYGCTDLTSIIIPDSVTSIGRRAFYNCKNLTSVELGSGVTSIYERAFASCTSLAEITIPDSLISIGNSAFYNCSSLKTVNNYSVLGIAKGSTDHGYVGYYADEINWYYSFTDNGDCGENLTYSYDSETAILTISGTGAMNNYYSNVPWYNYRSNIKTVVLPNGITTIGSYAFSGCTSLTNITIPDSVISIGESAFVGTAYINDLSNYDEYGVLYINNHLIKAQQTISGNYTIKQGTKTIASDAFYRCTKLTGITIADGMKSIGTYAFQYCSSLASITISDSVVMIERYAFSNCGLESVYFGENSKLESIGDYAFWNCSELEEFAIPDSVVYIGDCALAYTGIHEIAIPAGTKTIGDYAFSSCENLKSITVDENNEYYVSDSFGVLFNKDKTVLLQYPIGHERTSYTIPDTVVIIGTENSYYYESTSTDNDFVTMEFMPLGPFTFAINLIYIDLPISVIKVDDIAFYWCKSLTDVYYDGTESTRENISIGAENDYFVDATWHYGHECDYTYDSEIVPPTCTSVGFTKKICICGRSYPTDYVYKLDHNFDTFVSYETAHPHCGIYRCTNCEEITVKTDKTDIVEGCEECIAICPHTVRQFEYYETAHPHYEVYKCPDCGKMTVSDYTSKNDDCEECNPTHEKHSFTEFVEYQSEHPHCAIYKCTECSATTVKTDETTTVDSCETCNPPHVCEYATFSHYQSEHPHYAVYKCSCGAEKVTTETTTVDSCEICNPPHICDYATFSHYQTEHPHYAVYKCSCGAEKVTTETTTVDSCEICNPPHICDYATFSHYQTEHPHYAVYKCSCGAEKVTTETTTVDSCEICNPPHICDYATFSHYQTEHPHYAVYKCSCGAESVTSETTTVDSCEICNPPVHTHTPKVVRIEATCTVNGMEYTVCASCGEQIGAPTILPSGHKWGEWYVALEPTNEADGREERVCSGCGTKEERIVPKLAEIVKDNDSGIELVIPNGSYDEDIKLEIVEQFDGTSFQILNTALEDVSNAVIFDITTKINGEEAQPSKALTVKIPLPAGYDPNYTFVYHIDSETGNVENMNARCENGYLIFEATHFSYYSVVEISAPTLVSIAIKTAPSVNRYKYGIANLDTSGLEIVATYSDGSTKILDNSEVEFTGFDTSTRGFKTITANYEGCTATFNIEVYFTFWQWLLYIICFGWIWM